MLFSIFYFSGTGNTKWASYEFLKLAEEQNQTVNLYSIENNTLLTSDYLKKVILASDYIGFAHPIYGADIPPIMRNFIERVVSCNFVKNMGHKPVFVISTVGYVNSFGYYCERKLFLHTDFEIRSYVNLKLCNNASTPNMRTKPISSDKLEARKRSASHLLKRSLYCLLNDKRFICGRRPYLIPGILIRKFSRQAIKECYASLSIDMSNCVQCLNCVNNCPTNSIVFKNGTFTFSESCTSCMRCYNFCPKYAVRINGFFAAGDKYPRYKGPEFIHYVTNKTEGYHMRTEKEMFDLILNFAKKDPRIRAVYMNGSRTNRNAPKDAYQDYDIVYVVNDFDTFTSDHKWIDIFGERLILQMPEAMRYPSGKGHFSWMMLFTDGNRLDLTLIPIQKPELIGNDSLTIPLLDKDGILPDFPDSNDSDYIVRQPSKLYYLSCCNNFWWCMQNVAKGIARNELPYAMLMYHQVVREELHDMISWYIGTITEFSVSAGKMGKYFKRYLPSDIYEQYLATYSDSDCNNLWRAIFNACDLFSLLALQVAKYCDYEYNKQDEVNMRQYINNVKNNVYRLEESINGKRIN